MKIALITARGGSKGLPRKNILPVGDIPLIGWSIQAALDSNLIDSVFVSTEDQEIADVSLKLGAKIIPRPNTLALDTSGSEEVIEHAIKYLEASNLNFDTLVLLQPTSPLRTSLHINEAIELYEGKNASCVISVFEPIHTPIKAYVEKDDGSMSGLYSKSAPYSRRQDLPRAFQPNGAIYAFSVEKFKEYNQIPRENVYPYVMSEYNSADIDTLDDLLNVELILKSKQND
ncbi:cytidylyltransferase domain-containing protein [Moritella viscosa]|uniref:CMP-sialic acid synthetase n=1 Tax=Moritella viscosa TaxID=80854 RepID=A0A090IHB0_9GAMM|nr:acylneuraminate cytidylyltransferase family protein [Moritella viscosa]CED61676.1 N-acylneuraminate cytidylyltransferase [Moritella viscosa]SGY90297.1 CMP-sialic acid synthetase [Moritella viscosa]SGY98807.1 CMP-sialic acid synthetase [Moritella viscosa]SGY99340.1 CMP-sialic acid synthetase [Moritella viscosa]SHO05503.1 CMP-sialic acid synthetase [Moritella viscosa]